MMGIRRDEPNSLSRQHGVHPRCGDRTLQVFQRLNGNMDIPEQAPPREDDTGLEGPDLLEDPPHGQTT